MDEVVERVAQRWEAVKQEPAWWRAWLLWLVAVKAAAALADDERGRDGPGRLLGIALLGSRAATMADEDDDGPPSTLHLLLTVLRAATLVRRFVRVRSLQAGRRRLPVALLATDAAALGFEAADVLAWVEARRAG